MDRANLCRKEGQLCAAKTRNNFEAKSYDSFQNDDSAQVVDAVCRVTLRCLSCQKSD
jgi:hypothetical protein